MAEYTTSATTLDSVLTQQLGSDVAQEILSLLTSGTSGQTTTTSANVVTDYSGGALPAGTDVVYISPIYTGHLGNELADATAIIVPGTGSAQVILTGGVDRVIQLGGGNDTVQITGTTSDVITNVTSGDNIDTGAGFDKVVVAGNLSDYHTLVTDKGIELTDTSGHSIVIDNAEFVQFADGSVVINTSNQNDATVAKFYDIVLGREADFHGTDFWFKADDTHGATVTQVANTFLHSQEFTSLHGSVDAMSNDDFVQLMYHQAFGRDPDTAGGDFWKGVLDSGVTKAELVVYFANAAEEAAHAGQNIHVIPDILH